MAARKVSPIGAHIPVAGGLAKKGLSYADTIGAEAVQVFVSNPRGWAPAAGNPAQDEAFRDGCSERGIPAFVHAPYLINFGSPTLETVQKSVVSTAHSLRRGAEIGAAGGGVDPREAVGGTHRDDALKQVREQLLPLLDGDGPRLLIEPTAGGGQALAARVEQLEEYFDALDRHPRLGVCLDTCHAFAAGHDLTATGGARRLVSALTKAVGKGRLGLVHANDSKDPVGSTRDRHTTIGAGCIGTEPFAALLALPAVRGIPVIVETPEAGAADDVETLKRLRDR
jgi:deoxyribonuclease-4